MRCEHCDGRGYLLDPATTLGKRSCPVCHGTGYVPEVNQIGGWPDEAIHKTGNGFWGIVEVMGHKRYSGHVCEFEFAGTTFIRVDVPEVKGIAPYTKIFGPQAVFAVTPVAEDVALKAAESFREWPLELWFVNDTGGLGDVSDQQVDESDGSDEEIPW